MSNERKLQSETLGQLALALSKAQGQIKGAVKENRNNYGSLYADMESMQEAARTPLSENELAIVQLLDNEEEKVVVFTYLLHSSGEYLGSKFTIIPSRRAKKEEGVDVILSRDGQSIKAAVTNARTITFAAIINLAQVDARVDAREDKNIQNTKPGSEPHIIYSHEFIGPPNEEKEILLKQKIKEKLDEMYPDSEIQRKYISSLTEGQLDSFTSYARLEISFLSRMLNLIQKDYNEFKKGH